jgi:S1-C subfamily serine protease
VFLLTRASFNPAARLEAPPLSIFNMIGHLRGMGGTPFGFGWAASASQHSMSSAPLLAVSVVSGTKTRVAPTQAPHATTARLVIIVSKRSGDADLGAQVGAARANNLGATATTIQKLEPGSACDQAGLLVGDRIVTIGGIVYAGYAAHAKCLQDAPAGELHLVVDRDIEPTCGLRLRCTKARKDSPLGATFETAGGVTTIRALDPSMPLARAGAQVGDVVLTMLVGNNWRPNSRRPVAECITKLGLFSGTVELRVARSDPVAQTMRT